jgi:hypothetical protein
MKVRTFWTIFLKTIGIWLVMESISVILQAISALTFAGSDSNPGSFWFGLLYILLAVLVYGLVLRVFVFKTEWLINVLHLDKGFEEETINFDIQLKPIILVIIVVFGGFLFVDSFPAFCKQLFAFFQQKSIFRENPDSGIIIFYFIKTVISILLITNGKYLANLIAKATSNKEELS